MEPIIVGTAVVGGLYALSQFLEARKAKKGGGSSPGTAPGSVGTESGFNPFGPDAQAKAWYMATSAQWADAGQVGDNAGRVAFTFRGTLAGGDNAALRYNNDQWFRQAMEKGYRPCVSDRILYPDASAVPYLVFVPDGFARTSLPSDWGPLMQLYAPPPGYNNASPGQPMQGGGPGQPPFGGGAGPAPAPADPFDEIPDAKLRSQVREMAKSETVALLDLDETADLLEQSGYVNSAAALRKRRETLTLKRQIAAQQRGGYLYVVRKDDLPYTVAQYYGGKKPKVVSQLGDLNPDVYQGGTWAGWIAGAEVLLPVAWGDPSKKPLPPLAKGKGQKVAGGPGAPPTGGADPFYPFGKNPGAPSPRAPRPGEPVNYWYGPNGEGPFSGPPPKDKPSWLKDQSQTSAFPAFGDMSAQPGAPPGGDTIDNNIRIGGA